MEKVTLQTEPAGRTPAEGARAEVEQIAALFRLRDPCALGSSASLRLCAGLGVTVKVPRVLTGGFTHKFSQGGDFAASENRLLDAACRMNPVCGRAV